MSKAMILTGYPLRRGLLTEVVAPDPTASLLLHAPVVGVHTAIDLAAGDMSDDARDHICRSSSESNQES